MKFTKIPLSTILFTCVHCYIVLVAVIAGVLALPAGAAEWIMPRQDGDQQRWGLKGGVQFGIFPGSLGGEGTGGPRGLFRIWYPALPGGKYCLVNFVAVEPEVNGRGKGFSELERSELDQTIGKRITAPEAAGIKTLPSGDEELRVICRVEPFNNGAHVFVVISQRSNHPDELHFHIHAEPDSVPLKRCVLTATWGNLTRSRQLWLKDGKANSLNLYRDCTGTQFAPDRIFPLDTLGRLSNGGVLAAITTNEADPASVHPIKDSKRYYYGGCPLTQYWVKPHVGPKSDLNVRVNGRLMYWKSHVKVPGGITFENFEMRESFHEGEDFIFGVTPGKPGELWSKGANRE